MRRLRLLLLSTFTLLACAAHAQQTPVSEEERITDQAMTALWWGDFDELERQHAQYQQPGQRTAAGRSKLVLFRQGLDRVVLGPQQARDAFFVQMEALTRQWSTAHPQSALAQVLHAEALSQHGWSYRGGGYAKSVPPEAWRDFERYTRLALDHLAATKAAAAPSSSTYVEMLDLGRAAGWNADALWSVAKAGLALNVDDEGLYRSLLTGVLPKWGGSPLQVDRVINEVAKTTSALHGDIFYARMYAWAADWEFQHRLFADSAVSWPRMKTGFRQQLQRYPAPVNVNGFAYFACLARDKETLRELLERIGAKPDLGVWGSNAARTYETCKRWAAET